MKIISSLNEDTSDGISTTLKLEKFQDNSNEEILFYGINGNTIGHFESAANNTCMSLSIQGLCHYDKEPKRGIVHFDNNIVPYTASAMIKGKLNKEYEKELIPLLKEYNINANF